MSEPFPAIDPDLNSIIAIFGRKGSGKSVFARELFRGWPAIDKLVIDPTGDADPSLPDQVELRGRLPEHLPAPKQRGGYVTARYVANPASESYRDDLDRAVALALFPKNRRTLLWIDEAGEVFPANRTGPHARTLLQQSRHWWTSAILCTPRPISIDPLVLSQADRVVMYDVPHPRDRERLAGSIGIEPRILNAELDATRARGPHWFLMFDAREHALYRCPPLRLSKGYKHAQQ
ncbi:DNA helicase HerA-like ATPase [Nocardioides zeae]|uniref:DNA helicase HerA-like ATPase n=1 Tax=Nocardioides zeae TaxID=1457234 RepID=A0ACC6IN47_9ACTN|nr:ATP-binding protein [Nocardioides zeae]MDR6212166.1 DNA helicase HerA-like ATPase [Nocardioides zeae]